MAATRAATEAATEAKPFVGRDGIMRRACIDAVREFCHAQGIDPAGALQCAACWSNVYQGGRMWAGWMSYLTSFRDLGWLNLPEYEALKHYENAADAGFRVMHPEFCIVCDNPAFIHIDELSRPHAEDWPSHQWRDGWSLYFWHGQMVSEDIILDPASITIKRIEGEENAEVRRVMVERFGIGRYLHETGAKLIDFDQVEIVRGSGKMMPRCLLKDQQGNAYLEGTDGSTDRTYFMSVNPAARTCRQAHESICGLDERRCVAQS
jgi:hypothetical protein